jgi:hypothetical protein
MFLSILHNQSGQEYLRRVAPRESLDLRAMVRKWARAECDGQAVPSFAEPGAHIPNGCGEYQAELRDTKKAGASCWISEPFFMEWTGE